jgi:hypothetical protein
MGHSQGGLIAFDWWKKWWLKWGDSYHAGYTQTHVIRLFSFDSPINGACATPACLAPPGYPLYPLRFITDPSLLLRDRKAQGGTPRGDPFNFIGTVGDAIGITDPVLHLFTVADAYGPPGEENLQHQLLFAFGPCSAIGHGERCPHPQPPDHVSGCPITHNRPSQSPQWVKDDAHFIEKFCPENIKYFNQVLGLTN